MPHDTISPEFSLDSTDEILSSVPEKKGSGIRAAFNAAKQEITSASKHIGTKAILSAAMVAAAVLCGPVKAEAQSVQSYFYTGQSLSAGVSNGPSCPPAIGNVSATLIYEVNYLQYTQINGQGLSFPGQASNLSIQNGQISQLYITGGSNNQGAEINNAYVLNPLSGSDEVNVTYNGQNCTYDSWVAGTWSSTPNFASPKTLGGQSLGGQPGSVPGGSGSPQPGPGSVSDPLNGPCLCGDPINVATGNVFEQVTDYTTTGQNPLSFPRYYNSQQVNSNAGTFATTLGKNWRSTYDRYLNVLTPAAPVLVMAERANGQVLTFTLQGTAWTPDTDVDATLVQNGTTWTLTDHDDTVETYTVNATTGEGTLQSIKARNGYTQTLDYTSGQLTSVTDSYNRSLGFTYYANGLLETVSTPDGLTLTYGFTPTLMSNVLSTVSYSTSPVTSITYQYGNAAFPFALTGMLDENNNQYVNWSYDSQGRGVSSERGGNLNADYTQLTFNANGTTTVTNAFGVQDTYTFTMLQGVPKVTNISRTATSTTAAATRTFSYDTNGYIDSQTDWNGNQTAYTNDTHGDPTTINYAVNSSAVTYSVTTQYDPTWVRLPHIVTAPGVTSTYVRDGNGNPLSRTDVDTTSTTVPYSTSGQSREMQWTWTSTGQEQSIQLPRTDVTAKTTFGYTGGTLTSITDALSHETQITAYTAGGLPKTIVDPNNVTTVLTYDLRLNLHTSTLQTTAGNLTTTWTYNPANELQSLQQSDGSKLTFGYDNAHRLKTVTDLLGNTTTYTLDALGGATSTNVTNSSSTVTRTSSAVFDALDRMTSYIGGQGQTTVYGFDKMSNLTSITPPSPSGAMSQTFDALNRLSTHVDPAPGGTTTTIYDSFNRPLTIQDANGNTTSHVYDGFGDNIQTASPDSGTSVFTFNPDRDLTKSVLPGSLTMNVTFDALDRRLTVKYTGDTTLNVSNTFDQTTGHGFGVGRLTSATDQVGALGLTYDERGNITSEVRTPTGLSALSTSTTYDAASNVSSITYPSGNLVSYFRNSMGEVTSVTSKPSGASSATTIASGVTYEPLPEFASTGTPPVTGLTFGNNMTGSYGYDLDYRSTTRIDAGTATVQSLTYGYYANNSVQTITDAVNAANSQSMTYDTLDRLKTATSGAGGYGSYSFTWDPVNNIETQVINGTTTTYTLTAGTNKLAKFKTGTTTETVTTSASGNITKFAISGTAEETLTYNKANELATAATPAQSSSYAFDEFGKRLKSVGTATGTSTFQYDDSNGMGPGNNLLTDTDGAGNSRVDYIYLNGRPIGTYQPSNNKFYFVSTDRLGTPAAATDSSQAVQWSATYEPFGNTSTGASGIVQNLRLPGQEWDLESTFNRNGFRDYAGTLTRYIQTDPIGLAGGMNTFQYVRGNPFKWTDRRGLDDPNQSSGQNPANYGFTPSFSTWFIGELAGGIANLPKDFAEVASSITGAAIDQGTNPLDLPAYVNNQCNVANTTARASNIGFMSNADLSNIKTAGNAQRPEPNWFERFLIRMNFYSDPDSPP